ncbi:MAG: alpha/beta hydrolase, partial [Staphylococcus equorum]|nr:alpha/beta hydrolase [Staphylococcus equorum]
MTDIIIVHSKIGDATNHWYKWLANNLILEGYNVTLFDLPVEENDNLEQWVERMKDQITVKKYETYFITHGFGTLASLKYIEEMNINHIEGLFSVAGFMDDAEEIDAYIDPETKAIDYEIVKNKVDQFYGLCSKNDEYVSYLET